LEFLQTCISPRAPAERSDRKTRKQERDAARRLAALNGAAADAR
jgi:hypothetical protein